MSDINWDEPYGELCGNHGIPRAKYEQNGRYYGVDGRLLFMGELDSPDDAVTEEAPVPKEPEEAELEVSVDEAELRMSVSSFKDMGLSNTEIGAQLNITRQKVTKLLQKMGYYDS